MTKHIANIVTACRILGSALLLCFPAFSAKFYIIYIICGFTDMVDGTIARMTNSAGQLGAKIDTVADIAFAAASLIKILPAITLPHWLWIWGAVIAIIKIANIIRGYVSQKQFIALHTAMNKIAGMLLFLLPLTLSFADVKYTFTLVCAVATFAAIQEGFYILKNKNTDA
ncbi:MAG: CDP-alcohol phosphatidyltransferase family protein [Oscillospiraceae bacterium]|nr:CDP-alcohol phosphatidyltransferase family protein [Oscillospiraceae bacterium]